MPTLEKDIEKAVCAYARKLGCLVYKFVSPSQRGVPDRMIILPFGRVIFIEFKTPKGKLSLVQEREIDKMRKNGSWVYVANSVDSANTILLGAIRKDQEINEIRKKYEKPRRG